MIRHKDGSIEACCEYSEDIYEFLSNVDWVQYENNNLNGKEVGRMKFPLNFCPNCGAKTKIERSE